MAQEELQRVQRSEGNDALRENMADASVIEVPVSLRESYHFIRELGHGSQARVYQAVRLSDGKL